MLRKEYYLYIMASIGGVLYIGITNNLIRRVFEHKNNLVEGFTRKYKCHRLVCFESSFDIHVILEREKQLKRWSRSKKIDLINKVNPEWKDLSASSR